MDPKSEVLLRQYDFLSGRILLINAPTDDLLAEFDASINPAVWTWNFNDFQYFQSQQADVHFGAEMPEAEFDQAVIFVPKSKELLNYLLHNVAAQLKPGSSIFLVGEKKGGIERAAKQLQPYGKTLKLDSARHCQLWQLVLDHTVEKNHLQTGHSVIASRPRMVT